MIVEYHRPSTLEETLALLARPEPLTLPMGGGSILNGPSERSFAVVDVQLLGLNDIQLNGNTLELGAALTLQALLTSGEALPANLSGLREVIEHEATYHLRQVATVAGTLLSAGGRSPFATALLALDAVLVLARSGEKEKQAALGEVLPMRDEILRGALVMKVLLPTKARLAYHYAARSPADWPLVCAAVARWPSRRTRLALGGYGDAPRLALDGPELGGVETVARNAYSQAGDEWASAEYRQEVAGVLAQRCLMDLKGDKSHKEGG